MTYTSVQELRALLIFLLIVLTEDGFMPWSLSTSRRRACRSWTSVEGLSGIRTANLGGRRKPLKSLPSDRNSETLRSKIWFGCRSQGVCQWGNDLTSESACQWVVLNSSYGFLEYGQGLSEVRRISTIPNNHVNLITSAPPKRLDFCKTSSDGCFICPWVDDWCLLNIV